jgi:hypothetical protein
MREISFDPDRVAVVSTATQYMTTTAKVKMPSIRALTG